MNEKELIDFANWLWDREKLIVNQHLPPFETAEYWAKQYIKVKKLNIPAVSNNEVAVCGHPKNKVWLYDGQEYCNNCKKWLSYKQTDC
jgi:hypothetical protein